MDKSRVGASHNHLGQKHPARLTIALLLATGLSSCFFFNSKDTAKRAYEAQAKTSVGAMIRGEQAYHLENQKFSDTIDVLGLVIQTETEEYIYEIVPQPDSAQSVYITATPKLDDLSSFSGGVFSFEVSGNKTFAIGLCQSDEASKTPPEIPTLTSTEPPQTECPSGSKNIMR